MKNTTNATTRLLSAFLLLSILTGCQGLGDLFASAVGAPTSTDVKNVAKQLEDADKRIASLEDEKAAATAELGKVSASLDRVAQRRDVLERMQAELATKLATAPPEARTILLASIREIDAQIEGLTNEAAQIGRMMAEYQEQLVRVDVATARARRDLAEHEATLASFDERIASAIKRASDGVEGAGRLAGNLGVPGAGALASTIATAVEGGLGLILGGSVAAGVTTLRARRKVRAVEAERDEIEKERDGARKVIATTERFGIEAIANDPNTRRAARAAVMADDVARREFALAKADAIT